MEGNATSRPDRDKPSPELANDAPHLAAAGEALIEAWRGAVTAAGPWAVRFALEPGQALVWPKTPHPGHLPDIIAR